MWKVLLVDDEPAVVEGLRAHLDWQALDAEVVATASDGQEAIRLFHRYNPEIVITDIYMPGMDGLELMQTLHQEAPDTAFIVLSGYDEFDKARGSLQAGAVDYILKPATVGEIMAVIRKATERCQANQRHRRLVASLPALREYFLIQMLRQTPDPEEARFLGLEALLTGSFAVALVDMERTSGLSTENWQLSKLRIQEAAEELGGYPLATLGREIPVILHNERAPHDWCRKLLSTLQVDCAANVTIGLGGPSESVREAFLQAQQAVAYKEILGNNRVIAYDRIELKADLLPPYPLERNQALWEALRLGDDAAVRRLAEESLAHLEHAPLPYIRGICAELYGLAAIVLSERGLSLEDELSFQDFWGKVTAAGSTAEMQAWLADRLAAVASRLNVRRESRHERVLQAIDNLIAERYAEELTLEEVAKSVFLSRTYVASLFKQVRGRSFLEHLTRFRMNKARELLLSSDLSVYQVAEAVGYRDPAYFSRLFREHMGLAPSEVRR